MNISEIILKAVGDKIWQYAEGLTENIKFQKEVVEACKMNYCGMYGTRWTCPPGVGELKFLENKLKNFKRFFVFTTKHDIEDSFDIEGMNAGREAHQVVHDEVCAIARDFDVVILGAGACTICEKCTYPNAPCRFPDKASTSIEACGINVVELASDNGINYVNGQNTVTYFSIVFFERI